MEDWANGVEIQRLKDQVEGLQARIEELELALGIRSLLADSPSATQQTKEEKLAAEIIRAIKGVKACA